MNARWGPVPVLAAPTLSPVAAGPDEPKAVTGVTVDELALRAGDQELRGPATATVSGGGSPRGGQRGGGRGR